MVLRKFIENIRRENLLSKEDNLLIACSGGPDSIFMLHLFVESLRLKKLDLKGISVLHINHNTRDTSNRDEAFVRELASGYGLKVIVEEIYPEENLSEEYLRDLRIEIYKKFLRDMGFSKISLGHTSNDVIENFFIRLIRGTGLYGLVDLGFKGWSGKIIRPILNFSKIEIENYLKGNNIPFQVDESNFKNKFLRNRIRNILIPQFEREIDPEFRKKILHSIHVLEIDRNFNLLNSGRLFDKVCKFYGEKIKFKLLDFNGLFFSEKLSLLREVLVRLNGNFRRVYFKNYLEVLNFLGVSGSGKWMAMGGSGIYFLKEFDTVTVCKKKLDKDLDTPIKQIVTPPDEISILNYNFRLSLSNELKEESEKSYYYPAQLSDKIIFRTWERGDRLRFDYGRKKLKKFFCEKKIPLSERSRVVIVCDSENKIIWIPNLGYKFKAFNGKIYDKYILMEKL